MNKQAHFAKAEEKLRLAEMALSSTQTTELGLAKAQALVRLAEAHMKMVALASGISPHHAKDE